MYFDRYMKYKNKYLSLKNQMGGVRVETFDKQVYDTLTEWQDRAIKDYVNNYMIGVQKFEFKDKTIVFYLRANFDSSTGKIYFEQIRTNKEGKPLPDRNIITNVDEYLRGKERFPIELRVPGHPFDTKMYTDPLDLHLDPVFITVQLKGYQYKP